MTCFTLTDRADIILEVPVYLQCATSAIEAGKFEEECA